MDSIERFNQAMKAGRKLPLNVTIEIHYAGLDGDSRRNITTTCVYRDFAGRVAIDAFCHLRQEDRTFLLGAITNARDLTTNRAIEDLSTWVIHRFGQDQPEGRAEMLIASATDELTILGFVGRSDGALRVKEREHLAKQLGFGATREDAEAIRTALLLQLPRLRLDREAFDAALARYRSKPEAERTWLIKVAEQITQADSRQQFGETAALELLKKALFTEVE